MLLNFSTPVFIRHLRKIKTVVFLYWCLKCAVLCIQFLPPFYHINVFLPYLLSQSGANDQFYNTVYYITSNSNCEAHRVSKILKKLQKIKLEAKINACKI